MMRTSALLEWAGRPVDMVNAVYRVAERPDKPWRFDELMAAFGREPELVEVTGLVLGLWQRFDVEPFVSCGVAFKIFKLGVSV